MKKTVHMLLYILLVYFILIFDFEFKYSNNKIEYNVKYNGLVWVGLDYYSIWYYKSNDIPMKWLTFNKNIL